jgi:23S rRNA (cytosine1962-C5)-methyltransferase
MFSIDQYELLDFGNGRKLERFGTAIVDRPSTQAVGGRRRPDLWESADLHYNRERTHTPDRLAWTGDEPAAWHIAHGQARFELRAAPTGQVGIFPEQAENWDWLDQQMDRLDSQPVRVLNLFGYTGGSTLTVAAKAAETVHIDASKPVVEWGRRNAGLSRLTDRTIRWIVEDATKFVRREARRHRTYHGIVLDPPSFGHGPNGENWQFAACLPDLLAFCEPLLLPVGFLLMTCHTTGFTAADLQNIVCQQLTRGRAGTLQSTTLQLRTSSGESLASGFTVRWAGS